MTDKTELLPCPKCFGEAEILGDNMIACKDHECGIQMDWGHWCGKGAREKLILGWNHRAAPSPTAIPAGIPEGMVPDVFRELTEACWRADVNGNLSEEISGDLLIRSCAALSAAPTATPDSFKKNEIYGITIGSPAHIKMLDEKCPGWSDDDAGTATLEEQA